ncbi:MAG: molybdopterin-dependent oxidoreductase [Clostridium sp.]
MSKQSKWESFLDNMKLSRRSFLKVSAATAGVAALTSLTGCSNDEENEIEIPKNSKPENFTTGGDWFKNTCPRNCHDTCSIKTQVIDGKVIRIKGDDTNPYTGGNVCVKMNHYVNYLYNQDRLMYPMKRVGKKGEGKFERISWEEAYKAIVDNTKKILKKDGPNAIQQYNYSGNLGYVQNYSMTSRYFNKLGAAAVNGNICLATGGTMLPYTCGANQGLDPEQYANTKMYVSWGVNEAATSVHSVKFIKECQQNGGKIVVINPTHTPMADFADLYIKPFPGTDTVLALAIANILITENLFDSAYVEKYTHGFEELKVEAAKYPVDKASEITGVPVEQLLEFARIYAATKPSIIRIGYGIQRHVNGGSMLRAITFLPALVGMIGAGENAGYNFFNDCYWQVDWNLIGSAHLNTNENRNVLNYTELGKGLNGQLESTKETPIKQLFVFNGNPMAAVPNVELIRKGLERKDLFTIVADLFHTDTVDYADIVLPATSFFEHEDMNQDYLAWYIRYNGPAIAPLGECKSNFDIFKDLAREMGFTDKEFDVTTADIIEETLANASDIYGGINYEQLKEKHWHKLTPPVPFGDMKFPTESGKIEFYSEKLNKDHGLHPVVEHVAPDESRYGKKEILAKYPLQFLTVHTKNLINGQLSQLPHIQAIMQKPLVYINPEDASARGINEGDDVIIKNDRGQCKLKVKISSEKVLPGVILSYGCPWGKLLEGTNINSTTPDQLSEIGSGSSFHSNLVEVVKA